MLRAKEKERQRERQIDRQSSRQRALAVAKILHNLIVLLSVLVNLSVFGSTLSGSLSDSLSGSLSICLSVCIFTGLSCYCRVGYFSFVQCQQVQQEYCLYFLVLPHGVVATCVFNPHRCRCLPSLSLSFPTLSHISQIYLLPHISLAEVWLEFAVHVHRLPNHNYSVCLKFYCCWFSLFGIQCRVLSWCRTHA